MSKIIKWATYENSDATQTLKQHAFHSVIKKAKITGTEYHVAQSICGHVMVGEGDTLAETATIETIDEEVFNPKKACKACIRIYFKDTAKPLHQ